jgi:serine/threonine protein kinase
MQYPTRTEVVTAMRNPRASFKAKELIGGSAVQKGSRLIQYSGGFTAVFQFRDRNSKMLAVRCWIADIGDAKTRSQRISSFFHQLNSPYFIGFQYVEDALVINGKLYPVVVMDWVNGLTLKEYINENITYPSRIKAIAEKFREMVAYFHQQGIAHGDLQHGNMLITPQEKMVVIDYDSMYISDLENMKDVVKGLPGYQHPARLDNKLVNRKLDYFSELVIYLSLLAFAEYPEWWESYYETEDLLFSKIDFTDPKNSELLLTLSNHPTGDIALLTRKMITELSLTDIAELKPLEELLINELKISREHFKDKIGKQPNPPAPEPTIFPDKNQTSTKF